MDLNDSITLFSFEEDIRLRKYTAQTMIMVKVYPVCNLYYTWFRIVFIYTILELKNNLYSLAKYYMYALKLSGNESSKL